MISAEYRHTTRVLVNSKNLLRFLFHLLRSFRSLVRNSHVLQRARHRIPNAREGADVI